MAVITGDVQMTYDAERIEKSGALSLQIETGGYCHLSAEMIQRGIKEIDFLDVKLLVVENVGNFVCPSSFDLGEKF